MVTRRSARPSRRQDSTSGLSELAAVDPARGHELVDRLTMLLAMLTNPGNRAGSARRGAGVREDPAHLVIIDCMLFKALGAAGREGLRHVALFHTFDGLFRRGRSQYPRSKGLGPRRLWRQGDLAMVCVPDQRPPIPESGEVWWYHDRSSVCVRSGLSWHGRPRGMSTIFGHGPRYPVRMKMTFRGVRPSRMEALDGRTHRV